MIAKTFRAFPEQRAKYGSFIGGVGYSRARGPSNGFPPRWIWPLMFPALPLVPNKIFESIKMRLELVIGDAPILDGQLGVNEKFLP